MIIPIITKINTKIAQIKKESKVETTPLINYVTHQWQIIVLKSHRNQVQQMKIVQNVCAQIPQKARQSHAEVM